jgi:hypothetical protein
MKASGQPRATAITTPFRLSFAAWEGRDYCLKSPLRGPERPVLPLTAGTALAVSSGLFQPTSGRTA